MPLKPIFYRKALLVSLGFFLISICLGLFLRFSQVWGISGFNYKYILHGHSHITLLGWVYNAFFLAIVRYVLPQGKQTTSYSRIFWITQTTILASLISFPFQGYSVLSIVFSTLFIICSYWFSIKVLRDLKEDKSIPSKWIRWAIYYLLISSIGPWSLGAIMNLGLRDTDWYPLSIYFYLHFFYNGFFLFSIFGLAFKELEKLKTFWNQRKAHIIFYWFNLACIPTFLLSVLWTNPPYWVYFIAFLATFTQLVVCYLLIRFIRPYISSYKNKLSRTVSLLFKVVAVSFLLKLALQLSSSFPWMAEIIYSIKNYLVIGYIHVVMLGIVTSFLLGYFLFKKQFILSSTGRLGIHLFFTGFVASELLLFGQGGLQMMRIGLIPFFYPLLFICSSLIPLGIAFFFINQMKKKGKKNPDT